MHLLLKEQIKVATSVCIFAVGKNKGFAPSSRREQRSSALHLIIRFPSSEYRYQIKGCFYYLVEPRGIEPLSEGNLTRLSPSAVYYLHSLIPAGTNTLRDLVASLCMVRSKLCAHTVSTQITPEPGSWTFRGGWAPN